MSVEAEKDEYKVLRLETDAGVPWNIITAQLAATGENTVSVLAEWDEGDRSYMDITVSESGYLKLPTH